MNYRRSLQSLLLLLAAIFAIANAHRSFLSKIPNGNRVPNPCQKLGSTWLGVGHWKATGGGARNQFGKDFKRSGLVWNEDLCRKDSDGDGQSNGKELGDPNCVWRYGVEPAPPMDPMSIMPKITHPGVCEPVTSDHCKRQNSGNIPCRGASLKSTLSLLCGLLVIIGMMLR